MSKAATTHTPGTGKSDESADSPGMEKIELKRILKYAKVEPLPVVFATGEDGKAIVRLHRRRQPRALERDMKEAAPDSRNHRFGTAFVDPEQPKLLRFQVNRACSGMARKLIFALKGTGYNRVEINSDDGAPPERHTEPDDTEIADEPDSPAAPETPALSKAQSTAPLVARLTATVRNMLGITQRNPAQKAPLQKLAMQAQASIQRATQSHQTADFEQAEDDIDRLAQAIADASSAPPAPPANPAPRADPQRLTAALTDLAKQAIPLIKSDPAGSAGIKDRLTQAHAALKGGQLDAAAAYTQALHNLVTAGLSKGSGTAGLFNDLAAQWYAAEQAAQADVKKLKAALNDLYDGDPAAAQMEKDFQVHIDAIFGKFDGTLVKDVRKASAAKTPAELTAIKDDLRRATTDMIAFLQHDSVALMDSNPLVDIDIAGRCGAALKSMLAALA